MRLGVSSGVPVDTGAAGGGVGVRGERLDGAAGRLEHLDQEFAGPLVDAVARLQLHAPGQGQQLPGAGEGLRGGVEGGDGVAGAALGVRGTQRQKGRTAGGEAEAERGAAGEVAQRRGGGADGGGRRNVRRTIHSESLPIRARGGRGGVGMRGAPTGTAM